MWVGKIAMAMAVGLAGCAVGQSQQTMHVPIELVRSDLATQVAHHIPRSLQQLPPGCLRVHVHTDHTALSDT